MRPCPDSLDRGEVSCAHSNATHQSETSSHAGGHDTHMTMLLGGESLIGQHDLPLLLATQPQPLRHAHSLLPAAARILKEQEKGPKRHSAAPVPAGGGGAGRREVRRRVRRAGRGGRHSWPACVADSEIWHVYLQGTSQTANSSQGITEHPCTVPVMSSAESCSREGEALYASLYLHVPCRQAPSWRGPQASSSPLKAGAGTQPCHIRPSTLLLQRQP